MSIYKEIDRIIKEVRNDMYGYPFVCCLAEKGRYETKIVALVKRHIGKEWTMDGFLQAKLQISVPRYLANEYRILMLKNMKKMLRDDAKKKHALRGKQ